MLFAEYEQNLEKAREHLAQVRKLPALPTTATEIVNSLADEFVTLEQVADILQRDPSITARILSLANSAYYGQTENVTTVKEAIVRVVGLDLTRGVALGIALGSTFDTSKCPNFDLADYWRTSLYAAVINAAISKEIDCSETEEKLAFVAGLISQLGLLTLAAVVPEQLETALIKSKTCKMELHAGEKLSNYLCEELAFDQHAAGVALAELWVLPYPLIEALAFVGKPLTVLDEEEPLAVATNFSLGLANILLEKASNSDELESAFKQLGIQRKLSEIMHDIHADLLVMDNVVGQMV